jgi:hypothetical protein
MELDLKYTSSTHILQKEKNSEQLTRKQMLEQQWLAGKQQQMNLGNRIA